jgi:hemerythrin-like domain-containing protein
MRITDAFRGEHGVFYAQFDYLEDALQVPESVERVRDLARMLEAALEPHAHMEDELLFEPLMRDGDFGPMGTMEEEHREIEATLRAALAATDATRAADLLREVIFLAREHFLKEEQVAFPFAEARLGDPDLHQRGEAWAERRAVALA